MDQAIRNKLYVVVKCFQGIVEDVDVVLTEEQAEKLFQEFAEIEYSHIENIHDDYKGTSIFICDVPTMEGVKS